MVANMMMVPIVQTAHASCIHSPKGDMACSGGSFSKGISSESSSHGVSTSGRVFAAAGSGPSGARSLSVTSNGEQQSNSHNFEGLGNCADTTCSGTK